MKTRFGINTLAIAKVSVLFEIVTQFVIGTIGMAYAACKIHAINH
jgi:hypothetical protein